MSREAMQQALEALETCSDTSLNTGEDFVMTHVYDEDKVAQALVTLRAALAEPEQPVGINGLTEAETSASASVAGLVGKSVREPVAFCNGMPAYEGALSKAQRTNLTQDLDAPLTLNGVALYPRRKPLTDEERVDLVKSWGFPKFSAGYYDAIGVTHSVEAAHGIGDSNAALRERLGEGE